MAEAARPGTEHLPQSHGRHLLCSRSKASCSPVNGGTGSTEGSLWVCPEPGPRGQAVAEAGAQGRTGSGDPPTLSSRLFLLKPPFPALKVTVTVALMKRSFDSLRQ